MNDIISQPVNNDYDALQVSKAMQSFDYVEVISITCVHEMKFIVYAKYNSDKVNMFDLENAIKRCKRN